LFPFVDRTRKSSLIKLSPLNKKLHNVGMRRQHLDVMGVETSLQFVPCIALVLVCGVLMACCQILLASKMKYQ
jgi:hypothetical protein